MAATIRQVKRSADSVSHAVSPKEFCQSLWKQKRGDIDDLTRRGLEDIQLGILLIFYANQDPSPEDFETQLQTLISDNTRESSSLIRTAARRTLRLWSSRKWSRNADGDLIIHEGRQSQRAMKRMSA